MLLVAHILIALTGLVISSYNALRPTQAGLRLSGMLLVATLVSGTGLVINSHASLASACLAGIAYSCFCLVAIGLGWKKLARQREQISR